MKLLLRVVDRGEVTSAGAPCKDCYLQQQHSTTRETLLYRLRVPTATVARMAMALAPVAVLEESTQLPPVLAVKED